MENLKFLLERYQKKKGCPCQNNDRVDIYMKEIKRFLVIETKILIICLLHFSLEFVSLPKTTSVKTNEVHGSLFLPELWVINPP